MASKATIALAAAAGVALAACGGSSTSSSTAAPAAKVDSCLVGTWTTVPLTENSPANNEEITYSGGAGQVFTIDSKGALTVDTHAAKPAVFVSAGQTFTATLSGTGHGTITTSGDEFYYTPSPSSTLMTSVVDSSGVALGPPLADLAFNAVYACTAGQSFTFYKTQVNHMVDGPKIALKAGTG
jgi:hypothetical protein